MNKIEYIESLKLNPKDFDLKNITRVGSKRVQDGWWVRINRDGHKFSKVFNDKDYVNPIESLQDAILCRDSLKPKKIDSNTGYKHLSIYVSEKKYAIVKIWLNGTEKAFSINTTDYHTALLEAIKTLNKWTKNKYMPIIETLNLDKGLVHLNEKLDFEIYKKILFNTILAKEEYVKNKQAKVNKQKTILLIAHKDSIMDRNAIYSNQMKETLGYIKRKGYAYKIVNEDFKYKIKEYFSVFAITKDTSSKEFTFRLKSLVSMISKKFYTIQKESKIFVNIYKDNPTIKKEIINIIPDFKTRDELESYLKSKMKEYDKMISENNRKINSNLDNIDYVNRKKNQIKYYYKILMDYKRLIKWNKKG